MNSIRVTILRVSLLFPTVACLAPASAQDITPNPARAGQTLQLDTSLSVMSCFHEVESTSLESTPGGVRLSYRVRSVSGAVCFTVMPPLTLHASLGAFDAGQYVAEVVGTVDGVPAPMQSAPFSVQGGVPAGVGPASMVPATSSLALASLALLVMALAWHVRGRID